MLAFASVSSNQAASVRDRLRISLSRHYRLDQFDLFFASSLNVARLLLSRLFLQQEQMRIQSRYPVSELNVMPAIAVTAENVALVAHVDIVARRVRALKACHSQGVTDASESFATMLHDTLLAEASLFITRLDRHADLADMVLIALRTSDFSTLMRSKLRLFEQGMALTAPTARALARMQEPEWQRNNRGKRLMHSIL